MSLGMDAERTERGSLTLAFSDTWVALRQLPRSFSQKDLLRWLRVGRKSSAWTCACTPPPAWTSPVALEIDLEAQEFRLEVPADHMRAAQNDAVRRVADMLRDALGDGVPVFEGDPGSHPA